MKWRSCNLVVLPHEGTSGLQNLTAVAHHHLPAPLSWLLCHTWREVAVRGWITDFPVSGKSRTNSPISSTFPQNRIQFQNPLQRKKSLLLDPFLTWKKKKKKESVVFSISAKNGSAFDPQKKFISSHSSMAMLLFSASCESDFKGQAFYWKRRN